MGNADGKRRAIWATLLHCISTDEEPQHKSVLMVKIVGASTKRLLRWTKYLNHTSSMFVYH